MKLNEVKRETREDVQRKIQTLDDELEFLRRRYSYVDGQLWQLVTEYREYVEDVYGEPYEVARKKYLDHFTVWTLSGGDTDCLRDETFSIMLCKNFPEEKKQEIAKAFFEARKTRCALDVSYSKCQRLKERLRKMDHEVIRKRIATS